LYKVLTGGSIQFSLDKLTEDNENIFGNSSIEGKIHFSEDELMLSNINLNIRGKKLSGSVYVSNDEFYINGEEILKNTYGVQISTLAKELRNSIFNPDNKTSYSLDRQTYDAIIRALKSHDKNLEKDAQKLIKSLTKDIYKIAINNAYISSKSSTIYLDGKTTSARLISICFQPKELAETIRDIYDYLVEDDSIEKFINKYETTIENAIISLYGEDYTAIIPVSLPKIYKTALKELDEEIDNFFVEICDTFEPITFNIATPKLKAKLLKYELKIGKETVFSFSCDKKGIKNSKSLVFEVYDTGLFYKITKDDNDRFEAYISINSSNNEIVKINLEIDRKKDNYSLICLATNRLYSSYYNDYYLYNDKYVIDGTWIKKGDTTTLTIDKITNKRSSDYEINNSMDYENEIIYGLNSSLIFDTKDKMPSPIKSYLKISDITETNVNNWLEKLENYFE